MNVEKIINDCFAKSFKDAEVLKYSWKEEIVVVCPQWAIDKLGKYFSTQPHFYKNMHNASNKYTRYMGYDITPGYEQKIIIFNKRSIDDKKKESSYYELELPSLENCKIKH